MKEANLLYTYFHNPEKEQKKSLHNLIYTALKYNKKASCKGDDNDEEPIQKFTTTGFMACGLIHLQRNAS